MDQEKGDAGMTTGQRLFLITCAFATVMFCFNYFILKNDLFGSMILAIVTSIAWGLTLRYIGNRRSKSGTE